MTAPRTPRSAWVPAAALLPLRLFFGVTFVYAGLDKLLDPAFAGPVEPGIDLRAARQLRPLLAARRVYPPR